MRRCSGHVRSRRQTVQPLALFHSIQYTMSSPTSLTLPTIPIRRIGKVSPLLSEPDVHAVAQASDTEQYEAAFELKKPGKTGPIALFDSRDSSYTSVDTNLSFNDSPSPTGIVPVGFVGKTPMLNEAMDLAAGFHTLGSVDQIHRLSAIMAEGERALQEAQRNLAKETKLREGAINLYKVHVKQGNVEQSKVAYAEAKLCQKTVDECMSAVFRESTQLTASSTSLLRHTCATLRAAVLEAYSERDKERLECQKQCLKLQDLIKQQESRSLSVQTLRLDDVGVTLQLSLRIDKS